MNQNIFLRPVSFYQRQIDPLKQYVQQTSLFLNKQTGRPIEECRAFVIEQLKSMKDPIVRYYERNDYGDRDVQEITLSGYLNQVISNGEILAPSFTSYLNSEVKESLLVGFTDNNKLRRSKSKKEAQRAKAAGNIELHIIKNNEQTNMKLYNNSLSGAFATKGSVLHNPSAHSTLTSITRTVVSISNASNEKMLEGNRHYYNPEITLFNMVSIISNIDSQAMAATIERYGLVYPSVDDVISVLRRSTELYWHDIRAMQDLRTFVSKLDPVERAAIVYTGDMYHVKHFNPDFIRQLLSELSKKIEGVIVEDALKRIHTFDEAIVNLAHYICMREMKGKGKDYESLPVDHLNTVVATCMNIEETILRYKDFIETMFLTKNLPNSVSMIPTMVRRAVVVSDTDSTLFSTDNWVNWYFGSMDYTDESIAIAASAMFMTTQCMAHGLAIVSANINVKREKLFDLAMKPEYFFPVFIMTPVAKHYFALIAVVEGNVYEHTEKEIKGANLKSSSNARAVIKHADEQMGRIMTLIHRNEKISIINELQSVSLLEQGIKDSLLRGEVEYFKHSKIKQPEAYASTAEMSPYLHHMLWQQVFEPRYGAIEEPPYLVIKVPTTLANKSSLKQWVESIQDTELRLRLQDWLQRYKKTSLKTIYLSDLHVQAFGMPEEIKSVVDVKRIILDLTGTQRMILDSIGFAPKDKFLINELGY